MKKRYDFSKAIKNPYAKRLKRSATVRLDESTVEDSKALSEETELPCESVITLYLRDNSA